MFMLFCPLLQMLVVLVITGWGVLLWRPGSLFSAVLGDRALIYECPIFEWVAFGILDHIAGSSLLAQAVPIRWHTLLDIAHVIYKYVICLHPPLYAPRYLFMIKHI